ncbi:tandem-95 repeat protein, partial [Pseudomonas sp. BN417]|uniref:beta strand repeat-containing protein n=1 Tax=Pseudomonas sp. BN417 TaxID=2567890 RepID=UPI002455D0DA
VDGNVDHFVIKSLSANGTLLLNGVALALGDSVPATGNGASITFVPNANWNGTTSFQYASVDNQGLEDGSPATGTITVASVNDAPETATTSGTGNEDSAGIPVALSGSDVDGNVDHFVIKSLSANGTLLLNGVALVIGDSVAATANGASITFVPNANWNGTTSFQYASVDNQGLEDSSPATGTITVASVNDAPETAINSSSGDEDAPGIPVALSGSDVDGTVANFVIKSLPANGTLLLNGAALAIGDSVPASGNGATITFVPNANWNGTTSFQYASVDNQGLEDSSPATGTITVASVNDAPNAVNDGPIAVTEGTPVSGNVLSNDSDVDGDSLSVTQFSIGGSTYQAGQAALINGVGSLVINANGSYTFTPVLNYNGAVPTAAYTLSDGSLTDTAELSFGNVAPVNDAPETNTASGAGSEDSAGIPVALGGSDVDGNVASFVIKSLPANGTLMLNGVALNIGDSVPASGNGATVTFVPDANWNGSTSFQYASVDNQGLEDSSPATGTITVASVNDAPETAAASASGNEDAAGIPVALSGSDLDGSVDHFIIKSLPANGTLLLNGVVLALGDSVPATGNGASITFVPNANWNGSTSFQYASVDNQGLEDSTPATGTITVASVNDAPETATTSGTGNEDSAGIPVALSGSDLDGSVDHFIIKSLPANGTLFLNGVALAIGSEVPATANGASITFVPNANWNGSTNFQYASVDNQGLEDNTPATGTITVASVNDAPETAATSGSGNEDSAGIPVALSGSDLDGNVDHFVIKSLPSNGTLLLNGVALAIGSEVPATANGASITFVPNANWNGTTTFQYASVDNQGLEDGSPATGAITVASANDAPVAMDSNASTGENTVLQSAVPAASDTDGTISSYALVSGPGAGNGTLTFNGNGSYTFNPGSDFDHLAAGESRTLNFTYTATDNDGATSAPATITITVTGTNDGPVFAAVNLIANVSEEGLVNGLPDTTGSPTDVSNALVASGTFAISDVDGQSLSVTLTAPTTNLTSNGIPLTWSGNGTSTLSASAGGNPIMTVSITSTGAYLVTLLGQVDHLQANAEDVLSFSVGVTASDGQTSISSALQVRIEDDAPLLATPMQAILLDSSGATAIGDLNLSTGADINGASVQFTTTTGVSVDASGNILSTTLNKDGSVNSSSSYITYQGSKLHYVAGANSLTAVSADGTEVFKITADPASGQYQITNFVSLDSPSSTFTSFDLSGGNSGSYDLGTGSRFSLQATATTNGVADTVNTSNNSFGVGSGQSIDTGDLLSFTFIDKSTNQATDMTAVSVTTDKLGTGESLTWTAFDMAGNAVGSGTVYGVSSGTTSFTIDASKLNSGEYEFSTVHFGAGASTSYKLLISSITGQTEAYDQRISLGVKATDGDGDSTATQSLQITFDSDDTIQAGSNDSALGGGNGANNLLGGVGDDILTGGKGSDTLTGGSGADSFVWKAGDAGSAGSPDLDVVKDFNTSQDDRLKLSDLLQGETTSTIDNFLKLIVDSGTGNATLLVSKDGHLNDGGSAASHADLSITLEGAAAQLGGSSINSLIAGADPTIKVDHS